MRPGKRMQTNDENKKEEVLSLLKDAELDKSPQDLYQVLRIKKGDCWGLIKEHCS